jgi:hypothetical protein
MHDAGVRLRPAFLFLAWLKKKGSAPKPEGVHEDA